MANTADGTIKLIQELAFTEEERAELERAKMMPITFEIGRASCRERV